MEVRMVGQFFDTGFEGTATFVQCWPCPTCGLVVPAGACDGNEDDVVEIDAFCEDCDAKGEFGWFFVRPTAERRFEFRSGIKGWWNQA
jgi:hypothetical protein